MSDVRLLAEIHDSIERAAFNPAEREELRQRIRNRITRLTSDRKIEVPDTDSLMMSRMYEAGDMLIAAGCGKEGTPNTIVAMVKEIIADRDRLRAKLDLHNDGHRFVIKGSRGYIVCGDGVTVRYDASVEEATRFPTAKDAEYWSDMDDEVIEELGVSNAASDLPVL